MKIRLLTSLISLLTVTFLYGKDIKPDENKGKIISISNNDLSININVLGAELQNIVSRTSQQEYLWQGDSVFWKRRAPILFPFVGRLWNNGYNLNGKRYEMGTHGFAKDCMFDVIAQKKGEVWLRLTNNKYTFRQYPFHFELLIGYILEGKSMKVIWNVKNKDSHPMPFQIGGHPGFQYPDFDSNNDYNAYLKIETISDNISYIVKDKNGFFSPNTVLHSLGLNNERLLPISLDLFKDDALIFKNYQARKISILNRKREAYIAISFDMPVFAIWSNTKKNAPFICIEPWWGIGDIEHFDGDVFERKWMQILSPSEDFVSSYTITVLK